MNPEPRRRPSPPSQGYYSSSGQPGAPPPMRYAQPGPPPPVPNESLYDGSAYGGAENEWPLPAQPFAQQSQGRNSPPSSSARKAPPPRPQRPDFQPITSGGGMRVAPANQAQQYQAGPPPLPAAPSAAHHGTGQWAGSGHPPPAPPTSQQQQQLSHIQHQKASNRPPLGPPPSARRGPASCYPPVPAPVHPIVEETDSIRSGRTGLAARESMKSYASSNAITIGIPDYYLGARGSDVPSLPSNSGGQEKAMGGRAGGEEDSPVEGYNSFHPSADEDDGDEEDDDFDKELESYGRQSRGQQVESPDPTPVLIRQASFGRKSKPTLTTVKSGERMRKSSGATGARDALPSQKALDAALAKELGVTKNASSTTDLSSATGLFDTSSDSDKSATAVPAPLLTDPRKARGLQTRGPSPLTREVDPRVESILGGLEKGGALSPSSSSARTGRTDTSSYYAPSPLAPPLPASHPGLSASNKKRPPRLNIDTVKEAEQRGSLTSLPDLIKRATALASNLDRGKTASRLGMTGWFDVAAGSDEKLQQRRSAGGLSDILANFPAVGAGTPRTGSLRGESEWPTVGRSGKERRGSRRLGSHSDAGDFQQKRKSSGRRCCGLPLWLFLLLLVLLICVIAAAIIVPVMLIVVPKQRSHTPAASSAALGDCPKSLPCANGGSSTLDSAGACSCLCANGFTGPTCSVPADSACTTSAVGSTSNATLGSAVPRLLEGAVANFSVPLQGEVLLGLFAREGMSCGSENALVSFNGASSKRKRESERDVVAGFTVTRRQDAGATTNGIVFETGSPTPVSASPSSTSSTSAASSTSTSNSTYTDPTTLDFARVAVLYLFQVTSTLSSAVTAQENLQSLFSTGSTSQGVPIDIQKVDLGGGWSCDLMGRTVATANGTAVP